ncbi:MAG: para-aminobenzoate synthetase component 1, partial [Bacteroidia bacterium]
KALQSASPAPFSSYVCIENKHLISSSPERFMSRTGNALCSQPIKGTAARSHNQVKDFANKKALQSSIKERAEHIMIVDLVRNDLSQVAEPGSVTVSDLFGIYGYEHVYQMVSTIQASALPSLNWMDIFDKTFPMGSMTGAPKRIVLDFIDDFENTARGWYSGAVGYVEPNGDFDFSVIIRSLLYDRETNCASFAVGGAITYDSNSTDEFNESLLKGQSIQDLMQSLRTDL